MQGTETKVILPALVESFHEMDGFSSIFKENCNGYVPLNSYEVVSHPMEL